MEGDVVERRCDVDCQGKGKRVALYGISLRRRRRAGIRLWKGRMDEWRDRKHGKRCWEWRKAGKRDWKK